MPTSHPRIAQVRTAEIDGSRPSQDRTFTTSSAVIVLDGASHSGPSDSDGGWLAEIIGNAL